MAIQQLTQPILNPIVAFDATKSYTIDFIVIGGAQVIGNRLVISNNQTGAEVYNQVQSTMKLEHTITAGTLSNGGYYNAVIYTIDSGGNESVSSIAVPFYCYSQPVLTIDNIPATETIENGTYAFSGTYLQQESEALNSYQYTLYDSNREILSQSPLIYYEANNSLTYTFVGMSNDTSYYIELTGQTINGTPITSGLRYFTVRYLQPASFAICDLVNNCENGYIQISSNIVAIDGHSNPDPPIYIDDKEVDLRDPNAWVEWNEGFRIQNDFTMRVWGRDFNPYQNIITLTNDINSSTTPNRIEMKWMIGDVIKNLPEYKTVYGHNINLDNSEEDEINNLTIRGYTIQKIGSNLPSPTNPSKIYSVGEIKNLIDIKDFNIKYDQDYSVITFSNFKIKPNYIYTLSFDYMVNNATTDLYFTVGYGTNNVWTDAIIENEQYINLSSGRNTITFVVPDETSEGQPMPTNVDMYFKFVETIILADVDVDISNIQLEAGGIATEYQAPNLYNIYPTVTGKNIYNYKTPLYLKKSNVTYSSIQNGYNIQVKLANQDSSLAIGCKNILNSGDTYAISYNYSGSLLSFKLYTTEKESQEPLEEINLNNGVFTAPEEIYDLQIIVELDSSNASNFLEIWNIQIEANDTVSEYEPYEDVSSILTLDAPLMAPASENLADLVALTSPNILNQETQSATVLGDTVYILMQDENNTYYLWYYNAQGNLIKFLDEEGHEKSGVVITGSEAFTTHKDCVTITITKSNNPDAKDVTEEEITSNHIYIEKGYVTGWYPYFASPSLVRNNNQIILNGTENWIKRANTNHTFQITVSELIVKGICDYYPTFTSLTLIDTQDGIHLTNTSNIIITDMRFTDVEDFKAFITQNHVTIQYYRSTPSVIPLTDAQAQSLRSLKTFNPISNVFTYNEALGTIGFDYTDSYTEQQTQNAYVQLKCYNANSMPYFAHSNYIDIPDDASKVFIWLRRKNNLFDLKIEDLGDYNEDDNPSDTTKPIVTLDINLDNITQSEIPVTANSIDETGLRTVRFSKDNGVSWDEIIPVDGLSSTNSYTFTNLNPDTFYTIRVEAIDLTGNIGGMSQRVTTKA